MEEQSDDIIKDRRSTSKNDGRRIETVIDMLVFRKFPWVFWILSLIFLIPFFIMMYRLLSPDYQPTNGTQK